MIEPKRHIQSGRRSPQRALEEAPAGRLALSLLLVVTLAAILATNLPESPVRRALMKPAGPFLYATGLDQNWGVFAPDPRRQSLGLEARLVFSGGGQRVWRPPDRDPFVGTYSDYRWRKYMENAVADNGNPELSRGIGRWLAQSTGKGPEYPVTIAIVKRHADLPPPGASAAARQSYSESPVLTYRPRPPTPAGR
jgi:hypothetical protein